MKLFVYSYRDFDEGEFWEKYSREYQVELGITREAPTLENAYLAKGYDYISIITTKVDAALVRKFHEIGIKMISTRTIGFDHIDGKAAAECGIAVSNVTYSPACVADYAVMLLLMSMRKMKRIMQRGEINDFSLPGIQGRELCNLTVGVIGTGRIGATVIRDLSGFGCRILAYDPYQKEEVKNYAEYVSLDEIYQNCDAITLHIPMTDENYHMIDAAAIAKMKDQVILVNTARGGLIDTKAMIEGIESEKIGAVGLDVIEDEFGMYYFDRKSDVLSKRDLYILRGFPNVIVTPHMAFYSDQAISDMVEHSIQNCLKHTQEHGC